MKPNSKSVDLHQIFSGLQEEMVVKMKGARRNVAHGPSKGREAEEEWIELFKHFLPRRYQAERAFVVDCHGMISDEIDIVIFDRQYSPFLAKFREANFVPAESVYAVFEVKQDLGTEHLNYAAKKAASVRRLHRTAVPIVHAGGIQSPRPPFKILAGLLCHDQGRASSAYGVTFEKSLAGTDPMHQLDFICCLEAGACFVDWSLSVPTLQSSKKDTALVTFVLGVIRDLQKLGTVPALDLNAYLAPLLKGPVPVSPRQ